MLITAVGVQDRDGAEPLLWNLRKAFPLVRLTWADGGYAGKLVTWAKPKLKPKLALEIVKRPGDLHTFQVLPCRWVAGQTWHGSPAAAGPSATTDYPGHHETMIHWGMTITMTRRLARLRPAVQPRAA